jgi:hypothetical protein
MFFPRDAIPFRTLSIVCALTALFAVSMGARHRSRHDSGISAPANPSSSSATVSEAVQSKSDQPQVQPLPIVLKSGGFVPMDVIGAQGDYFFSVLNQSGTAEIVLRLDREHGNRLHEDHVKKERLRWRKTVHLTPGVYVLTEANHPQWVCRITINSK